MCVMLMCTRAYVVPTSSAEYEDGLMPRSLVCNVRGSFLSVSGKRSTRMSHNPSWRIPDELQLWLGLTKSANGDERSALG